MLTFVSEIQTRQFLTESLIFTLVLSSGYLGRSRQLAASSLYSRPYSRACWGHCMDLSAMSRRHL